MRVTVRVRTILIELCGCGPHSEGAVVHYIYLMRVYFNFCPLCNGSQVESRPDYDMCKFLFQNCCRSSNIQWQKNKINVHYVSVLGACMFIWFFRPLCTSLVPAPLYVLATTVTGSLTKMSPHISLLFCCAKAILVRVILKPRRQNGGGGQKCSVYSTPYFYARRVSRWATPPHLGMIF